MRTLQPIQVALTLALVFSPVPFPLREVAGRGANGVYAQQAESHCRIHNQLPDGATNVGSGTLIDVTPHGERGLVLTCSHLFTEGAGKVVVQFPGGQSHGAILVAVDQHADLAALEIAKPTAPPSAVSLTIEPADSLRACGFGGSGEFQCAEGKLLGYSERHGQVSLRMAGPVRSGDSGGGVFDGHGRLCAVVWGESGGVTYASTGRPLATFLQHVLSSRRGVIAPQRQPSAMACPDGRCPLVRPAPISAAPPVSGPSVGLEPASRRCGCAGKLAAIAARLDALQNAGANAAPSSETPIDSASSAFSKAAGAAASLAVTALGISGPAGWGAIVAVTIGGWLLGRRRSRVKRRESRASTTAATLDSRPSTLDPLEATAAADDAFPIERDDREARELLRLSQLEGRDPLQDALAGRLALDRLDAIAEGDADSPHATWADRLRRELREKFNEIAPTTFHIPA